MSEMTIGLDKDIVELNIRVLSRNFGFFHFGSLICLSWKDSGMFRPPRDNLSFSPPFVRLSVVGSIVMD